MGYVRLALGSPSSPIPMLGPGTSRPAPVVDWHPERAPQPQITAEKAVAYGGIAIRQATTPSVRDFPRRTARADR